MINPYITEKLNPLFVVDESRRKELLLEAEKIPSVIISSAAASNAVMLASGYFNPLKGYMNLTEVLSVAEKMQLPSGILWPIPVVNLLKENNFSKELIKSVGKIALRDPNVEGNPIIAIQSVEKIEKLMKNIMVPF